MKEATTKRFKILVIILYFAVFAMNLAFVINWEDVFLPDSVTLVTTDVFPNDMGKSKRFSIYQLGSNYYITLDKTVRITYQEYKYCMTSYMDKDLKEYYDEYEPGDNAPEGEKTIIRDFFYRKEYPYIDNILLYKMSRVYDGKYGKLYRSTNMIFEKYGAECFEILLRDSENCITQSGSELYEPKISVFCGTFDQVNYHKEEEEECDERIDSMNRQAMAEVSNIRLWQDGEILLPLPTDNKLIIEPVTKLCTGKDTFEYLYPQKSGKSRKDLSYARYCFKLATLEKSKVMNKRSQLYYKLRYMDIMLKGKEPIYFRTFSDKDLTVLCFAIPSTGEDGSLAFETHDRLTRQLVIWNLKLAIITNGRIPVISGSFLTIHVLFIAFVQNLILAVALLIGTKIKQKVIRRQICH